MVIFYSSSLSLLDKKLKTAIQGTFNTKKLHNIFVEYPVPLKKEKRKEKNEKYN